MVFPKFSAGVLIALAVDVPVKGVLAVLGANPAGGGRAFGDSVSFKLRNSV